MCVVRCVTWKLHLVYQTNELYKIDVYVPDECMPASGISRDRFVPTVLVQQHIESNLYGVAPGAQTMGQQ